ncbi:MAG: hypothetical protein E7445_02735 [Ruminococcaceae bacterium]|nr:hypothetical protein [Oscillospiraceae bacterium]
MVQKKLCWILMLRYAENLPASLTSVGECTFEGCGRLTTVHYAGTEADWQKIQVDSRYNANGVLLEATIKYESQLP